MKRSTPLISLRGSGPGAQEASLLVYLKKHDCFNSTCRIHGFPLVLYINYLSADPDPFMDPSLGLSSAFNPATRGANRPVEFIPCVVLFVFPIAVPVLQPVPF